METTTDGWPKAPSTSVSKIPATVIEKDGNICSAGTASCRLSEEFKHFFAGSPAR